MFRLLFTYHHYPWMSMEMQTVLHFHHHHYLHHLSSFLTVVLVVVCRLPFCSIIVVWRCLSSSTPFKPIVRPYLSGISVSVLGHCLTTTAPTAHLAVVVRTLVRPLPSPFMFPSLSPSPTLSDPSNRPWLSLSRIVGCRFLVSQSSSDRRCLIDIVVLPLSIDNFDMQTLQQPLEPYRLPHNNGGSSVLSMGTQPRCSTGPINISITDPRLLGRLDTVRTPYVYNVLIRV